MPANTYSIEFEVEDELGAKKFYSWNITIVAVEKSKSENKN